MRVLDLAAELDVPEDNLILLLREMGISVTQSEDELGDGAVAKLRARVERERRGGHETAAEAVEAALEEAQSSSRRRRRRAPRKRSRRRSPESEEETEAGSEEVEGAGEEGAEEGAEGLTPEGEGPEEVEGEGHQEEEIEEPETEVEVAGEEEPDRAEEFEGDGPDAVEEEVRAEEAEEPDDGEGAIGDDDVVEAGGGEEVEEVPVSAEGGEDADTEEGGGRIEAESGEGDEATAEEDDAAEGDEEPQPVRKVAPDAREKLRKPRPAASAGPGGQVRIQAEGYTKDGRRKKRKGKGKKGRRERPDKDAVQENIQRVMAELKGGGKKKKKGRSRPSREEREAAEEEARVQEEIQAKTVKVNEYLTVAELAELIDESASSIIGSAFKNLGLMVTINQRLDFDQIELLLEEFGYQAVREEDYDTEVEEEAEEEDRPEDLEPRPPVVTVMGHVDHGKTLLLDYIRKSNVVAGEAGGITQHIGAYHVEVEEEKSLSFLDTPGHAAFTAMRSRGAEVTDIVILVIAADDSVMPQTVEAVSHAKNAGVPIVVAINKCDLPAADPMKVKQELLQHEVTVEEFGGDVLAQEVSAKTGEGVDELLEKVLLQAELLELEANPERPARGTVIEAQLDVGKGPMVTILVQNGTLRTGDDFICGLYDGRVRAMFDERGNEVEEAGPGTPVQILGAGGVPQAGDSFAAMEAERAAEIASTRQRLEREKQLRVKERGLRLGDLSQLMGEGEVDTLPLIIKGDVDGSVQALADSLEQLSTDEVAVEIVHRGVGAINESDVLLAETSGAVIIGFRVRPDTNARQLAEREDVDIQTFDVIYEAVDQIRAALEGMLSPEVRETVLGSAEIRETFRISGVGTVAGCYVTDGRIDRKGQARVIRNGVVVYDGEIASLKRFKDDVKEVREGFECGIGIANFNDVKIGDVIECYQVEEVARTLAAAGEARG